MRKNKWLLPKIMIYFAFVAINLSCEKEEFKEQNLDSQKFRVKEVKLQNLMNEPKFINLLQNITDNSVLQRSSFENQNGFTISNDVVKIIETDSLTSYTMKILCDNPIDNISFYNLVVQEDILNNQKAAIYKYTPNSISNTTHNSFHFDGTIDKFSLGNSSNINRVSQQNATMSDCYDYNLMCNYGGTEHPAGVNCTRTYVKRFKVICTSPPFDGGFGDTGGGGGGANDNPSDENNEIITTPILTTENPRPQSTPCTVLNKMIPNNSIQQTLRILKGQSSGAVERGNYMSETTNSVGATYLSYPVIPVNPNNPSELNISGGLASGKVKGAMHCHRDPATTGMFPMFSAADLTALYNIAYEYVPTNSGTKDYAEFTVMLSVGSGHYALKFKNFNGDYNAKLNLHITDFQKYLEEENRAIGHMASSTLLTKIFLKNLNKYFGNEIGLYKATEGTDSNNQSVITGWKELRINENEEVVEIDCQ